jgi:hypothetical protein
VEGRAAEVDEAGNSVELRAARGLAECGLVGGWYGILELLCLVFDHSTMETEAEGCEPLPLRRVRQGMETKMRDSKMETVKV